MQARSQLETTRDTDEAKKRERRLYEKLQSVHCTLEAELSSAIVRWLDETYKKEWDNWKHTRKICVPENIVII